MLVPCSAGKLAVGIDIRGEGGFVVRPGSRHKNGGVYAVEDESAGVADAPGWLLESLAAMRTSAPGSASAIGVAALVSPAEGESLARGLRRAIEHAKTIEPWGIGSRNGVSSRKGGGAQATYRPSTSKMPFVHRHWTGGPR